MIIRSAPSQDTLKNIYETIKRLMPEQDVYYTDEEVKELKKDNKNIFLK